MTRTLLVAPEQRGASRTIAEALAELAGAGAGAGPDTGAGAGIEATIRIAPGIYPEAVLISDTRVRLVAADGPDTVTIDASAIAYPVLRCHNSEVTLENLTLRGGGFPAVHATQTALTMHQCSASAAGGSGITAVGGTLNLRRCSITGAQYGIVIEEASGLLEECSITDIAADALICGIGAPTRSCVRASFAAAAAAASISTSTAGPPSTPARSAAPATPASWSDTTAHRPSGAPGCTKQPGSASPSGAAAPATSSNAGAENTASPAINIADGATTTLTVAAADTRPASVAPVRTRTARLGGRGHCCPNWTRWSGWTR